MQRLLIGSILCTSLLITSVSAQTLAPDGSFVGGNPELSPDRSYSGE